MTKHVLVHCTSSLQLGGAEALLVDLVRDLGTERYEHHVLYIHDGPRRAELEALGAKTYSIQGSLFRYDPTMFFHAYRIITRLKPSVIHAALWAGCWVARIVGKVTKIPVVCVVHLPLTSDGKLRNFLDGRTWRWADQVVAVSQEVGRSLSGFVPAQRIEVIPNGINARRVREQGYSYHLTRQMLGLAPDHFVIGCVGRFVPHKRQDLLIRVFARFVAEHPQARLLLLGVGPEEQALRALVTQLRVSNFVQFIIAQPALGYYPLFDCFVLPSVLEGLSVALLEAASFGLPAIVTGVGSHEVIQDGVNGFVVPPDDERALLEALKKLACEPVRSSLGVQSKEKVEARFSSQEMMQAYRTIFDRYCGSKQT